MNVHSFIIRQIARKETPKTQSIPRVEKALCLHPLLVLHWILFSCSFNDDGGFFRITLSHIISFRFHAINLPYEPISL